MSYKEELKVEDRHLETSLKKLGKLLLVMHYFYF